MATNAKKTTKETADKVAKSAKATNTKTANRVEEAMETASERVKETAEKTRERVEGFVAQAQDRAKETAEKLSTIGTDMVEFQKANVEAMIESGKITAKGVQDIAKQNAEYARENLENASNAMQGYASVKSPRDLIEMQNERARAGFDTMVSQASHNTEAMMKLAGEAFQPISDRFAAAMENFRKAA